MAGEWIHSQEGIAVTVLETKYNWWIPEEKLDEVIGIIKDHFDLPGDLKPRWYLVISTKKNWANISRVSRLFPARYGKSSDRSP